MNILHYKFFLKYFFIILILYNLISLTILFNPIKSLKYKLWRLMPYDYTYSLNFPVYLEKLSLLNSSNINEINLFLNKNTNRNLLNINFWNKKLIINNYSKSKNQEFEKSFINLFFLTKNNSSRNLELKKYFILNYDYFSEESKKVILDNYS
tara:strand:- start:357 stop:812 length:456 start_codon:yes stop_codon:yes gene_type:complete